MAGFRVSRAALADIREVGRYTQQQWGKVQRRLYLDEMNNRFQFLAENSAIAPERRSFDPPVRIYPFQKHLIVFVMEEGGILILRILHQRMDVSAHLS